MRLYRIENNEIRNYKIRLQQILNCLPYIEQK